MMVFCIERALYTPTEKFIQVFLTEFDHQWRYALLTSACRAVATLLWVLSWNLAMAREQYNG